MRGDSEPPLHDRVGEHLEVKLGDEVGGKAHISKLVCVGLRFLRERLVAAERAKAAATAATAASLLVLLLFLLLLLLLLVLLVIAGRCGLQAAKWVRSKMIQRSNVQQRQATHLAPAFEPRSRGVILEEVKQLVLLLES